MQILSEDEVEAVSGAGFHLIEDGLVLTEGLILTERVASPPVSPDAFLLTE